jgi:hypothetical protein
MDSEDGIMGNLGEVVVDVWNGRARNQFLTMNDGMIPLDRLKNQENKVSCGIRCDRDEESSFL